MNMSTKTKSCVIVLIVCFLLPACSWLNKSDTNPPAVKRFHIDQIDSFNARNACSQGVDVLSNNGFSQELFDSVFAKVIEQCGSSKSPDNADIIWKNFVQPLKDAAKVPSDLVVTTCNYYFSKDFVSLPDTSTTSQNCHRLTEIKKNIEKEYQLKIKGFEITLQKAPDTHFVNAMYVFNTMWAACHGTD